MPRRSAPVSTGASRRASSRILAASARTCFLTSGTCDKAASAPGRIFTRTATASAPIPYRQPKRWVDPWEGTSMDVLAWWLGVVLHHGLGGIAFGLLTLAVAGCVVLAVLTGLLHLVGGFYVAFKE